MTTATPAPRWAEYQPIAHLRPALRNAKGHDLPALGASVQAFGFIEPVVVDERTGLLLSGHGRTEHLATLAGAGSPAPDGVVVGEDGQWQVLVVRGVASKDDAHAEAMGIALNRVGERGGWQPDILTLALDELRSDPELFDSTGWTTDQLDELIAGMGQFDQGAEQPRLDQRNETQGLHVVALTFSDTDHREYQEHLAKLKRVWHADAAPTVLLRSLREAAEGA